MTKSRQVFTLLIGVILYGLAIKLQLTIAKTFHPGKFMSILLAFLPMVPALWFTKSFLKVVSEFDELKKKIIYESAAFSLIATTLITLSYGFLEELAGLPKLSMSWVWPLIGINLVIGKFVSSNHYK